MSIRVAVDTGGTFTDCVWIDPATGRTGIAKLPSTPDDPSAAIASAIAEIGAGREDIAFFSHGTTVGTNALLEERGARVALVVTEGFRGIYEVQEQMRGYGRTIFDRSYRKPALLAPPRRTIEAPERIGADGTVVRALTPAAAEAIAARVRDLGAESVAICLLFSFRDERHERLLGDAIERLAPGLPVSLSSAVLPEIREYYRLSTTVINAYLRPVLGAYLERLDRRLGDAGVATPQRYVMQSNGGVTTLRAAAERAATTVLSGPAGGVTAAAAIGALADRTELVTFDMGGTSCDVALVSAGRPGVATRTKIGGRDLAVPMLDIHTVSAGGGTIARVERLGGHPRLAVGPRSAGARPGPAAYGHGGSEPTITDAHVVLGTLGDAALAGRLRIDRAAAQAAVRERIARPLGLSIEDAAAGMLRIIDVQMEEAIRSISTRRGHDLRTFTLVAFGGAGPLHAARLARDLGMRDVLVPLRPGVTSALGLLMADVRHDRLRSRLVPFASADPVEVERVLAELEAAARDELHREGFPASRMRFARAVDCRYAGQGYELTVTVPDRLDAAGLANVRERFDAEHQRRFGHSAPDRPAEILTFRVSGFGSVDRLEPAPLPVGSGSIERAHAGERAVHLAAGEGPVRCRVFARDRLAAGDRVTGPAIFEQLDATTLVLPGQEATVLDRGDVRIASLATGVASGPDAATAGGRR